MNHLQSAKMLRLYGELHDQLSVILEETSSNAYESDTATEDRQWLADRLEKLSFEWSVLNKLEKKPALANAIPFDDGCS